MLIFYAGILIQISKFLNNYIFGKGFPLTKKTITIEDLTELQFVGTPQCSPDKSQVVYTLAKMDLEQNGYVGSLWLASSDKAPMQLTTYRQKNKLIKDREPLWSKDGDYIYFLSLSNGM